MDPKTLANSLRALTHQVDQVQSELMRLGYQVEFSAKHTYDAATDEPDGVKTHVQITRTEAI